LVVVNSFEILKGNSLEASNIVNPFDDEENQQSELSQILERNKDQVSFFFFFFFFFLKKKKKKKKKKKY